MSSSLDFNNIATWENIDRQTACMRLCSEENENNYNPGCLQVSMKLFNILAIPKERAQFFLNCEKLGLRGWKLFFCYKYPCHSNYDKFIQSVLKSDEAMLKALKEKEMQ